MEYEHPDYGQGVHPFLFDPSPYLPRNFPLPELRPYSPLLAASQGVGQGLETAGKIMDLRQNMIKGQTNIMQQQQAQDYLSRLNKRGLAPYVTSVRAGDVSTEPFPVMSNTAALDLGLNPKTNAAISAGTETAEGQRPAPVEQPVPVTQPPSETPAGQLNVSPMQAKPQANIAPATGTQPTASAETAAAAPTHIATPEPASGQAIFDQYKKNISGAATGWHAEVDPQTGQLTGRTIIQHNPKTGLPDQPIHPEWAAQNLGIPARQANPAMAGAQLVAAVSPVMTNPNGTGDVSPYGVLPPVASVRPQVNPNTQAFWADRLLNQPMPPSAPSAGNGNGAAAIPLPAVSGTGDQMPVAPTIAPGVPSTPEATTALINQLGGPLQASAAPQAGLRADAAPSAQASPTPQVRRAIPVSPDGNPANPEYWKKAFGMNPETIATRMLNPNYTTYIGTGTPTNAGTHTGEAYDQTGADGTVHRFYVDPDADGGRASLQSIYTVKAVQPGSEVRSYLDGKDVPVHNQINEAQNTLMNEMIIKHGGYNPQGMNREQKEASYRQAVAEENIKPAPESTVSNINDLRSVLYTGNQIQQLIGNNNMTPQDRNPMRSNAQDFINKWGGVIPKDWAGKIKEATGSDPTLYDKNIIQLTALHNTLMNQVKKLQSSPMYADHGIANLDTQAGNPTSQDYYDPVTKDGTLHQFLLGRGAELGRVVDSAQAQGWRVPADAVYLANVFEHGDNSPGATNNMPIRIGSQNEYDKYPPGTWMVDSTGNPFRKQPKAAQ